MAKPDYCWERYLLPGKWFIWPRIAAGVWRQQQDILGYRQSFGLVRTGSVGHHHDAVGRVSLADLGEKLAHALHVHLATQSLIQLGLQRIDGAIQINELPIVTVADHRPQRCGLTATLAMHHPSEPGLVLKHRRASRSIASGPAGRIAGKPLPAPVMRP